MLVASSPLSTILPLISPFMKVPVPPGLYSDPVFMFEVDVVQVPFWSNFDDTVLMTVFVIGIDQSVHVSDKHPIFISHFINCSIICSNFESSFDSPRNLLFFFSSFCLLFVFMRSFIAKLLQLL